MFESLVSLSGEWGPSIVPGAMAFCISAALVCVGTPLWIAFCRRCNAVQPIRSSEVSQLQGLHQHKARTPTMGGIIMVAAILISTWLTCGSSVLNWAQIAFPTACITALGAGDDWLKIGLRSYQGISAKRKLIIQTLIAALVASTMLLRNSNLETSGFSAGQGLFLPWYGWTTIASAAGSLLLWILAAGAFVSTTNAVNLTDGMDGLASGLLAIAFSTMGLLCVVGCPWIESNLLSQAICWTAAATGACLAFLIFNRHPAKIFMGDTGSMGLGALLASLAIGLRLELLLAILAGCFVIETVSVMLQVWSFRSRGRRIFRCAPIHHHFEMGGISETKVVCSFWVSGIVLALITLWAML